MVMVLLALFAAIVVAPPVRVIALPDKVKEPAPLANAMDAKLVPAAKLLVGAKRVDPAKTNTSPATGATPPTQLAAVVQLLSPPPPFQVRVVCAVVIKGHEKIENMKTYFRMKKSMQEKECMVSQLKIFTFFKRKI